MPSNPDAIVLFSGGLDSILAATLLREQGLSVLCLHLSTPFFGTPDKIAHWQKIYGLDIFHLDASLKFAAMLAAGPDHGFGRTLNPCVDCKILQMREAASIMRQMGAKFVATGEVLGQRPMSQRSDMLNHIPKKAGMDGMVLRPLCAKLLEPTIAENSGLVDRGRLLSISGRGRNPQLELAHTYRIREIPTPAGGCRLTEKENSRRYWQVLKKFWRNPPPTKAALADFARSFSLANLGRQFMANDGTSAFLLCIGRNAADNAALLEAAETGDVTLKLADYPGPVALARNGLNWPVSLLEEAAAALAAFSPRARETGAVVRVGARPGQAIMRVWPKRPPQNWELPAWETVRSEIKMACQAAAGGECPKL